MTMEQPRSRITSSEETVAFLRGKYPRLYDTPTLCVNDMRLKRPKQNLSPAALEVENSLLVSHRELVSGMGDSTTSVDTHQDRFYLQPTTIVKPFKNSVLFATLHQMARATSTNLTMTGSPTTTAPVIDYAHAQHIQRHSSSSIDEITRRQSSTNNSNLSSTTGDIPSSCDGDKLTAVFPKSERSLSLASSSPSLSETASASSTTLSPSSIVSTPTFETEHGKQLKSVEEFMATTNALLVDDNPVNQKVLARMLRRLGLVCKTAQNGEEACDIIRKSYENGHGKPIDLVFMDIWMPKMNGLEAATVIRKELSSSSLQPYIIAMTACVMPGDREKCIQAGMNAYVSKPVRKQDLEAAIHIYTQTLVTPSPLQSIGESLDVNESDIVANSDLLPSTQPKHHGDTPIDKVPTTLPIVTITQDD
ncbi:CheY-like superfamily [Chlamydoabsidia padenii]|nr:CheY-like superfamily [Chlamydoabsidia padenii]